MMAISLTKASFVFRGGKAVGWVGRGRFWMLGAGRFRCGIVHSSDSAGPGFSRLTRHAAQPFLPPPCPMPSSTRPCSRNEFHRSTTVLRPSCHHGFIAHVELELAVQRFLRSHFRWNAWNSVPYRPLITIAAPETRRRLAVAPLIRDKRCYGESPARPAGRSGAGAEE